MPGNKPNNKYLFHKFEAANNREGSAGTQANRASHLHIMARELSEMGYRHLSPRNFKRKHLDALVGHWLDNGLAIVTIKGRMSTIRWLAAKIGKPNLVPRTNAELGIPDRVHVATASKALTLTPELLARVPSPYVRISLEFEEKFGMRREEAAKIRPHEADQGDKLVLQGSWCKGKRAREIPIRTAEQRDLVDRAKALAQTTPQGSLIPTETYYQHQGLRTADVQGGDTQSARAAACLCAGALRGPDRLAVSGRGRSVAQGPDDGTGKSVGRPCAAPHQRGDGPWAPSDPRRVLW